MVRLQTAFEQGLIVTGFLALCFLLPRRFFSDAAIRFYTLSLFLEHGQLSHTPYSLVGPLFALPLWLLGKVVATSLWWCQQFNLLIFILGLLVLYQLLKTRLERSLLHKFILILLSASMFANHITTYFNAEVFTAICVGVDTLAAVLTPSLVPWCAIILGIVNTPAGLVGLACIVLKQILDRRHWRLILALITAATLIAAEAWLRRGSPFISGYEGQQFNFPFFLGLLSLLFSFGKGLLFFAPGLLLPLKSGLLHLQDEIRTRLSTTYSLWICFLIGLLLVYASWWSWYGAWFWGPRVFLFASLPASFALAVHIHYRSPSLRFNLLTLLVLALSTWVGNNGAIFDQDLLKTACTGANYNQIYRCLYDPTYSALWRPWLVKQPLNLKDSLYLIYCLLVFAYLAIPLLKDVLEQTVTLIKTFYQLHGNLKAWPF